MNETLRVVPDPVADLLDDLAVLSAHWTRNRERGRMPKAIRLAMLLTAADLVAASKCELINRGIRHE